MRVLVATHELQGTAAGDVSLAIDGELVAAVSLGCPSPVTCGCGRGFTGLGSRRLTTTAVVSELAHLDRDDLWDAVEAALEAEGVLDDLDDDAADALIDQHIRCIEISGSEFPVGAVVSRWGANVWERRSPIAA